MQTIKTNPTTDEIVSQMQAITEEAFKQVEMMEEDAGFPFPAFRKYLEIKAKEKDQGDKV